MNSRWLLSEKYDDVQAMSTFLWKKSAPSHHKRGRANGWISCALWRTTSQVSEMDHLDSTLTKLHKETNDLNNTKRRKYCNTAKSLHQMQACCSRNPTCQPAKQFQWKDVFCVRKLIQFISANSNAHKQRWIGFAQAAVSKYPVPQKQENDHNDDDYGTYFCKRRPKIQVVRVFLVLLWHCC